MGFKGTALDRAERRRRWWRRRCARGRDGRPHGDRRDAGRDRCGVRRPRPCRRARAEPFARAQRRI